jgi:hypothetical protein
MNEELQNEIKIQFTCSICLNDCLHKFNIGGRLQVVAYSKLNFLQCKLID